jgi:hypothetical protein
MREAQWETQWQRRSGRHSGRDGEGDTVREAQWETQWQRRCGRHSGRESPAARSACACTAAAASMSSSLAPWAAARCSERRQNCVGVSRWNSASFSSAADTDASGVLEICRAGWGGGRGCAAAM